MIDILDWYDEWGIKKTWWFKKIDSMIDQPFISIDWLNCRWLHPILKLGYHKDLDINDVYRVLPEDGSEKLGLELQR